MVHRIQKAVPDPEIDKYEDAGVGDRLDRAGAHVVRHARAVFKESREPSGLHDPNKGKIEHSAGNWNRWIRASDDRNRGQSLENRDFVFDSPDHLGIGESR